MAEEIHYMLDENDEIITTTSFEEWGAWFETANRALAQDVIRQATVSTVFLGVDHSFTDGGPPILFETMIFGGPFDELQWRYETAEDALAGHERIKQMVMLGVEPTLE